MTGKVTPKRLPLPRTLLGWDGTDFFALRVDSDHHLQIDVLSSVMDADAATEATLASVDGYLGLLSVLWNCLRTVGTDRFMVKGEDQLHSYTAPLVSEKVAVISGANGYIDSHSPADGLVWHVTHVTTLEVDSATTALVLAGFIQGTWCVLQNEIRAIGAAEYACFKVDVWLEHNDFIRPSFAGGAAADGCRVQLIGEVFTKET